MRPIRHGSLESPPLKQLDAWYQEAMEAGIHLPDAFALASVAEDGAPSVRMVLLKRYSEDGLVFFTNYYSRKGMELESNPIAAGTLWWGAQERAVRFEGSVHRCDEQLSDEYFASRPHGSRVAAIISPQSQPIGSHQQIERAYTDMNQELGEAEPVRPDFWGGYVIVPRVFEFWQGMPDRLHQRTRYELMDGNWHEELLAP